MPEKKGRKRRPQRERRTSTPPGPARTAAAPPATARPTATEPSLPAMRVRYAGLVLALLTGFIGILTAAQAFQGASGPNFLMLLVAGVLLVALALVIGVLALAPERVRALFQRE
ncbi:MAG: hypothetical protein HY874_00135 [Chloroflexi bacterium]|nr:hypothetical protein [Chloroflexota bacterium]